jgi:hypothetical protein
MLYNFSNTAQIDFAYICMPKLISFSWNGLIINIGLINNSSELGAPLSRAVQKSSGSTRA